MHGSCHILHLRMSYSVGRERTGKAEPVVPAAEGVLGVVRLQHRTDIGQPHAVARFTLGGDVYKRQEIQCFGQLCSQLLHPTHFSFILDMFSILFL